MLTVGNPRTMRSVLGHKSWRRAIGEGEERRRRGTKVLPPAVRAGSHRGFGLITALLKQHVLPMQEVN